jgi:hypothetical protein
MYYAEEATMENLTHTPIPVDTRRSTLVWLALIAATLATWGLGEEGASGPGAVAALLAIAALKSRSVILDFMGLRHAPLLWKGIVLGWLALVCTLIALAYWKGMP